MGQYVGLDVSLETTTVHVLDDESNRNRGSLLRLRWRGVEFDPRWRAWPDTKW
jgi:hypothetical protein